jgi:hypothetical protein
MPTNSLACLLGLSLAAISGCREPNPLSGPAAPSPAAGAAAGHASPYVQQLDSPVRGLSAQEVEDLLNGRGMGLARAAELSGYPGPRHVLDLASELALDAAQREDAQSIFERMQREAKELGAELVELERALGQSFVDRTASEAGVAEATAAIGELQGRLRAVHLRAHVELTEQLDPRQIARYSELRGYTTTPAHGHGH